MHTLTTVLTGPSRIIWGVLTTSPAITGLGLGLLLAAAVAITRLGRSR